MSETVYLGVLLHAGKNAAASESVKTIKIVNAIFLFTLHLVNYV